MAISALVNFVSPYYRPVPGGAIRVVTFIKLVLLMTVVFFLLGSGLASAQWRTLDSFADGDFTANPTWLADITNISIVTSDAGPATPAPTATNTVRLKGSGTDTDSITVVNTNAGPQQEWACWWGRRAQAATVANRLRFWIYANETNLESATVDGYAVRFGDDTVGDELFFERMDNGVATTLITGSDSVTNTLTDIGFCVRVSWSNGNWKLYCSPLPPANGGGTNHLADPSLAATVIQGSASNSAYIPANGYLGFQFIHSSGASAIIGAEVDQIMVSNGVAAVAGPAPEMAVLGTNGAEIVSTDYTPSAADGTDFGKVSEAGSTSITNTYSITNSGNAELILNGSPSVSLYGDADFSVLTQPASTNIAAGGIVTFRVVFNPQAGGTRTSLVSIANTDGNENPYLFALRGTSSVPDIAVLGTNGAVIANNDFTPGIPDGTDFRALYFAGSQAFTNTFSITNSGNDTLILNGSPSVSLYGDADFTVLTQPASTNLAIGGIVTFRIVFDPVSAGTRTSLVSIANSDPDENPYRFLIRGTGVAYSVPSVTTSNMTSIGTTNATGGGQVSSDGGDAVTNRGVCWNTTGIPTISDSRTSDGSGLGSFSSTLIGLSPGNVYYVRAFGQNSVGTGYGGQVVFTSQCFTATVTLPATDVGDNSFVANWEAAFGAVGYLLDVSTNSSFGKPGAGGIFISQYYEGVSNDKWIELYNGSGAAIDLTARSFYIGTYYNANSGLWTNDVAPDNSMAVTGTVAAGATYILSHGSASLPGYATAHQISSTVINFNGNDSVVLYTGAVYRTSNVVDSIGLSADLLSGTSIVRRLDISTGKTGTSNYASGEWLGYPNTTVDGASAGTPPRIGYHEIRVPDFVPGYDARPVGDVTSATVTGLQVGITYYYRVRATNENCLSGQSDTQQVTTVSTAGGITYLGTTSPSNSTFALDGQISAGEYGLRADVKQGGGLFTNLLLDADYENLLLGVQYSNLSTKVWTLGASGLLFSNSFGEGSFTTLPEILSAGLRATGVGRNDGGHEPTNGNPASGYAIKGNIGWTSFGSSYFTNSITLSNNFRAAFSNLTFQHQRYSGEGPNQWQVSYRLDGVGSFIVLSTGLIETTNEWSTENVDLSALPAVAGESTVEFRLDAWGAQEGSSNLLGGGIAIIGYNLDAPENFTFLVLEAFPEGTTILFTDNGWMMPENQFRTNESHFTTWTATVAAAVGDVIEMDLVNMNQGGDQWCAYQIKPGDTTFLYAVNAKWTNWQATADSGETSALYPGLTNGVTAVAVPFENAYYIGTTTGTPNELLAAISQAANWTGSTDALGFPMEPFTVNGTVSTTNDVAWSVDNLSVSARMDTGTGADSTSEVIQIYLDTDAGAAWAGATNLTLLTDNGSFLRQGATFSGPDAVAADPYWVTLYKATTTNTFDADFVAVLQPGVGGSNGVAFFGIDKDNPSTLTLLEHAAINNKAEQTAEFRIPWNSIRGFSPAQAADILNDCDGDSLFVFAVDSIVTNAWALEDTSPANHVGPGDGGLAYTNVWQVDLAPGFAEPTERPISVTFTNPYTDTYLTWDGGDGSFSIVIMRQGEPVDVIPEDGSNYTANSTFGLGDRLGGSNFVVAVTNGNASMIHGLHKYIEYYVAVFEGNGMGTCSDYLSNPRRNSMTPTLVVLYQFELIVEGEQVKVCWETASELRTVGFWIERLGANGEWIRVNSEMIWAEGWPNGGMGASYCYIDEAARPGETYTYRLIEVELDGRQNAYGPFERTAYALKIRPPIRFLPEGVVIRWLSRSNELYRVLRTVDLQYDFTPLATGVVATPPENVYTDRWDNAGNIGFYMISVESEAP